MVRRGEHRMRRQREQERSVVDVGRDQSARKLGERGVACVLEAGFGFGADGPSDPRGPTNPELVLTLLSSE